MKDRATDVITLILMGFYILLVCGVIAFWGLVIYALYLLVTGQLQVG